MGGVNEPNLLGQTVAYTVGKHQRKWLCRAAGSPPHGRSKTACHRPPPTKSVHVNFKNACTRNPPVRARQNMGSTRRPILCTTVRIFRDSAAPSSPWKPSASVKWIMEGVEAPGTKGWGSRPGGDAYWQFRLLNAIYTLIVRKSVDHGRPRGFGTLSLNMLLVGERFKNVK
jgi:hypothetical protein